MFHGGMSFNWTSVKIIKINTLIEQSFMFHFERGTDSRLITWDMEFHGKLYNDTISQ